MPNRDVPSSVAWFVGTCGISTPEWVGNFYPSGLRSLDWLQYYSTRFNSIELNTTFHGIPNKKNVRRWNDVTPNTFRFSLKFPKEVTHYLASFLSKGNWCDVVPRFFDVVQELEDKLAVILMQFPPNFSAVRRSMLFRLLDKIRSPVPLVVEFRNPTWWTPETATELRDRHIGWATADRASFQMIANGWVGRPLPCFGLSPFVSTADFAYVRFLGKKYQFPPHVREQFDSTARVKWWHERIMRILERCAEIRRVYTFFDNDFSGHAPTPACRLAQNAGLPSTFKAAPMRWDYAESCLFPLENQTAG